jgi:hypothetical protein
LAELITTWTGGEVYAEVKESVQSYAQALSQPPQVAPSGVLFAAFDGVDGASRQACSVGKLGGSQAIGLSQLADGDTESLESG